MNPVRNSPPQGPSGAQSAGAISDGMKTVADAYAHYTIMPALQLHQLRVAAVGKIVCDNFDPPAGGSINAGDVILACLFHDMGNIIKSDLTTFPEFLEPEGAGHWKQVKEGFEHRYGDNAHMANVAIARELKLPQGAIALIDGVSFSNIGKIVAGTSFEQKVVEYADCRVGPHGILALEERLAEARKRYIEARSSKEYYTVEGFEILSKSAYELETQIFEHAQIHPEDINDASVAPLIEELRNYSIA